MKNTISEMIKENKINNYSKEIIRKSIERANKYQKDYNCFVTITEEYAMKQDNNGILKNIPYALKDNYSTKNILTTGSSNMLKDYIPVFNSTVYEKLKKSGACLIGKTVLDELAMGAISKGHTGSVSNPWNKNCIAGGSSGGSAAAVALGIVPFAIGSDTGDSVRKPAAYTGVIGYKPTWGKISRYGLFPFACSLDTVGYFARSVKDIALLTDILKGKDNKDMTVYSSSNENLHENLTKNVKGKKLCVIKELIDINEHDKNSEVRKIIEEFNNTLKIVEKIGIEIEYVSIDKEILKAIYPSYIVISSAEATSNNSNLNGIIFGVREKGKTPDEVMFNTRTKNFSELIKRRFVLGSYVLQKENQEDIYLNACRLRRIVVNKINELFEKYDGLILPASSTTAPKKNNIEVDNVSLERQMLENNLIIGNFGGYPSITLPSNIINKMPVAINITGRQKDDQTVLNIAYAIESEINFKYLKEGENNEL